MDASFQIFIVLLLINGLISLTIVIFTARSDQAKGKVESLEPRYRDGILQNFQDRGATHVTIFASVGELPIVHVFDDKGPRKFLNGVRNTK